MSVTSAIAFRALCRRPTFLVWTPKKSHPPVRPKKAKKVGRVGRAITDSRWPSGGPGEASRGAA
jgi:hypothetical protein